jgi:hypothetical protein
VTKIEKDATSGAKTLVRQLLGGQTPAKHAAWGRAQVIRCQRLNKEFQLCLGVGALLWVSPGRAVPESGLASRVAMSLKGSPSPPEALKI